MALSDRVKLSIDVLGPFALRVGNKKVTLTRERGRALLGHLALTTTGSVNRHKLVGVLWNDKAEASALTSLRQVLPEIRAAFAAAGFDGFSTGRADVALDLQAVSVDAADVLASAQAGQAHPLLFRSPRVFERMLEEFSEMDPGYRAWLLSERQSRHDQVIRLLQSAMVDANRSNRDRIQLALAVFNLDPTYERAARLLIQGHWDQGDVGGAFGIYKRLRDILALDYDAEPSSETNDLVAKLRLTQPAGANPPIHPASVTSSPGRARSGSQTRRIPQRLVAILSTYLGETADAGGSGRKSSSLRLRQARTVVANIIECNHGRLRRTQSQAVIAVFESPMEAMASAIEIERYANEKAGGARKSGLQFRIGLTIGDAVLEGDELFGAAVDLAEWLQLASDGNVIVSEAMRNIFADKPGVAFESLGSRSFDGSKQTVPLYRLLADRSGPQLDGTSVQSVVNLAAPVPGFGNRPALAVLPFEAIGNMPDSDHVGDGLTEDIINGLSKLRWLPTIARNSSFLFRGRHLGPTEIGRALGARYLLTGSIRMAVRRMRLSVTLIDALSAQNLWNATYDGASIDIFKMQDDISMRVVATLDSLVDHAEQKRAHATQPGDLDVRGLIWRGRWHQNRLTRDDAAEARSLFERALEVDPDSAEALIQMSWWYCWNVWTQRGPRGQLLEMRRLAQRARLSDPLDGRAHMLAGIAENMLRNPDAGLLFLRQAVDLTPSLAVAHSSIGSSYMLAGKPEKAIEPLLTALRLSPHDLYVFHALGELASVHYMLGLWDEALEFASKSLSLRPSYWYSSVIRIGTLARRGDFSGALHAEAELRLRHPNFSNAFIDWLPFKDKHWNAYLTEGLDLARRHAGLAELGVRS
jgi:adenylate cyclase